MTEEHAPTGAPIELSSAALPGGTARGTIRRIGTASTLVQLLRDTASSAVCGVDGVCEVPEITDKNSSTDRTP
ncbi:hypothetical protein [Subtercola frigoramans]|uniref:Uncharacterized protein n=1 Tax=Subtercola frigoramans TaxID=120298 RepID=A0ABS2L5N3_9MICO|nr:hypothetical protein [Subtercola frigoramans]MBM7472040.1 hypothetical protein [Subtercola frigoramans]